LLLLFKFKILIKEQENLIYFYIFLLKRLSYGMFSVEEEEGKLNNTPSHGNSVKFSMANIVKR
jgi:hypothetical protein